MEESIYVACIWTVTLAIALLPYCTIQNTGCLWTIAKRHNYVSWLARSSEVPINRKREKGIKVNFISEYIFRNVITEKE